MNRAKNATVGQRGRISLEVLSLLSKKWHPVVLLALEDRAPLGFNQLSEAIPAVSGKVLTETLDDLDDAGLVERTVVSESPLRVEYELTAAGREMDSIFDELAAWGEEFLETALPVVLLADADPRLTEMYGQWLDDRYTVLRAHDGSELFASLADDPDVVVFAAELPDADPGAVVEAASDCRTIVLVGERPGQELLAVDCDDVLRKPIVRDTALDAVETQLARRGESDASRERAALAAKRTLFESAYSREFLESSRAFDRLESRLGDLDGASGE